MPSIRVRVMLVGAFLATRVLADWTPTGPFGGEAEIVRTVPQKANFVIAATRNGLIYHSADGGASWTNRHFPAQLFGILHALEVDPRYSDVWYAAVESENPRLAGVYKTDNGGDSWTQLPGLQGRAVWSLAIWPGGPDVVAAGTADGVFLTTDAGASWVAISPARDPELRPVVSLAFDPANSKIIYAGTTHLPWRTRDGGGRWESIHSGMLDDSDVFSIVVDAQSPSTVFASACSGVYRSGDAGASWRRMATPPGAFRTYLVTLDPRHAGVVFAGTSAGLLRSADGGALWKRVSRHAVKSIAFDPANPNKIYFASIAGGLLVSRDGGNTLVPSNIGFSNRNFSAIAGSAGTLYTSTVYEPESGGIFRTVDNGLNWSRMTSPGGNENVLLLAVAPDNPDHVYAATSRTVFRSTDGARTWTKQGTPRAGEHITALLPLSRGSLLVGTSAGLFRSATSWVAVKLPGDRLPVDLLQGSGGQVVAAVTSGRAFRSDDAGESWTACGQPGPGTVWYGLAFDPVRTAEAMAATAQGLFRSTDGCASWELVAGGLDRATVTALAYLPRVEREAFAVQSGRVFRSTDGGISWRPLGREGPNRGYPSALVVLPGTPRHLFALFPRRGVLAVSIESDEQNSIGGN